MARGAIDRPWAAVSTDLADSLRDGLTPVIADVIDSVTEHVPEYDQPADEPMQQVLRMGVGVALERLIDLLGTDTDALGPAAQVYERIGAAEYESGRPLQAVLAAYRVGATATWRGVSRLAVAAGADAAQTAQLAEACFTYIDEISAVSAAGYAKAQSAQAARRDVLRAQALRLLLGGDVAEALPLAQQAGVRLPDRVVVVLCEGDSLPGSLLEMVLGEALVALLGAADLPRWRSRLEALNASVGTSQPLAAVDSSRQHAELVRGLRAAGALPATGVLQAADHLPEILLAGEPVVAAALRDRELAGLAGLADDRRAVVVDTAVSWLLNGGARAAVAEDLHIHPQTVAYRMEKVREVFADQLATADGRWALLVALKAEQLARPAGH